MITVMNLSDTSPNAWRNGFGPQACIALRVAISSRTRLRIAAAVARCGRRAKNLQESYGGAKNKSCEPPGAGPGTTRTSTGRLRF